MARLGAKWFGKGDKNSSVLDPLVDLNQGRDEWAKGVLAEFALEDLSQFSPDAAATGNTAVWFRTTAPFVDDLIDKIAESASEELDHTGVTRHRWRIKRSSGWRKVGTGTQNVLSNISEVFKTYSGLAEVIKGADEQFGGLAYGTFSLFLSVAALKQHREEEIDDALQELADASPRLEFLWSLQPRNKLRLLIVEAFALMIQFCRETTTYFAKRWRLPPSPKDLKMEPVVRLRRKLIEVHKEIEVVQFDEILQMRRQLNDIQIDGKDTNYRVRDTQTRIQDVKSNADIVAQIELHGLKQALGLAMPENPHIDLVLYQAVVTSQLSWQRTKRGQPVELSWSIMEEKEAFQKWFDQTGSPILLIGGDNIDTRAEIQVSWLSQASILVMADIQRRHEEEAARVQKLERSGRPDRDAGIQQYGLHALCRPLGKSTSSTKCTFSLVVRSLIIQLAQAHPTYLRRHHQAIVTAFNSVNWHDEDAEKAFECMIELLTEIVAELPPGINYTVVIDRLDQCYWTGHTQDEYVALAKAVWSLIELVKKHELAHLQLRVLLVMDAHFARKIARTVEKEKGGAIDWILDWDQETDDA